MARKLTYEKLEKRVQELEKEPSKLKRVNEALRESERELTIRNRIKKIFLTIPDKEMYGEVLQVVLEAMDSRYGIFGYIEQDGALICPSMTRDIWDECQIPDKDIVFPRESWGGIWGRALIAKKVLYSNQPFRVPQGHIPIHRALALPIIYQDGVIGLLHVANKATDYKEKDKELLEAIAEHIAPILHARLQRDRQERERKQAEEALKESEGRYRSLYESSVDGIAGGDMEGSILECNQAYSDMLGYTKEEIQKLTYQQLTPKKWHKMEADIVKNQIIARGYSDEYEKEYIRKDGTIFPISARVWLRKDEKGEPVGMWGIARDITERKRADQELLESEEKYRRLFERANDAIFIADTKTHIIMDANRQAEHLIGRPREEIIGMHQSELHPPYHVEYYKDKFRRHVQKYRVLDLEAEVITRDGSIVPVFISASVISMHGKEVIQGLFTDISEEKRILQLTEELATKKLIEKAKGVLMHRYNISEKEAMRRLQKESRRQRKKVKEIAQGAISSELELN